MDLKQENEKLKERLLHAQDWMIREIKSKKNNIDVSDIKEKIYMFFPAEALSYFPQNAIDGIVSAEIIYQHIIAGEDLDGMSAILSYLKVVDEIVELYISKGFRKFTKKKKISYINDPLEKSLRLVVEKNHTFSLGRLYQSLEKISKNDTHTPYVLQLCEYLKSRPFLEKSLLSSSFLLQLKGLIDLHVLSDKRHKGMLSKKDTIQAREILTGNFKNTASILYILTEGQTTI